MKRRLLGVIIAVLGVALFLGCQERPVDTRDAVPGPQTPDIADISNTSVAILIAEGFHDGETLEPQAYMEERGATTTVIGKEVETVTAYNSDETVSIEKAVADISVEDFDALIIPGGQGPELLREDEGVLEFVRAFVDSGKPVAAICHGPQVLVSAGVVEGKEMTCFPGMSEELIEADAEYVDVAVQRDENIITSRVPDDIGVFNEAIVQAIMEQM